MMRRTRLLIKPKVGPSATASSAKPTTTTTPATAAASTSSPTATLAATASGTTTAPAGGPSVPSSAQPARGTVYDDSSRPTEVTATTEQSAAADRPCGENSANDTLNGPTENGLAQKVVGIVEEKAPSTFFRRITGPRLPPTKTATSTGSNNNIDNAEGKSLGTAPAAVATAVAGAAPVDASSAEPTSLQVEESPTLTGRVPVNEVANIIDKTDRRPDEDKEDRAPGVPDGIANDETTPISTVVSPKQSHTLKAKRARDSQGDSDPLASLPPRLERKAARKANESREMLIAARRRFAKVKEPVDTSKLTMLDLIYYNPPGAPMKRNQLKSSSTLSIKDKRNGFAGGDGDVQESLEPELEDDSTRSSALEHGVARSTITATLTTSTTTTTTLDTSANPSEESIDQQPSPQQENDEEEEVIGPRVVVGADGSIQIDEASLVIRRPNPEENKHNLKVTVEEPGKTKYDSFKTKKTKKCTWTTRETSKFYRALSICGTDFTLMTQFFPTRSRQDLKNKFKREERSNSGLVDKAIHHPTQFEFTERELEDISREDDQEVIVKKPREPKQPKAKKSNNEGSTNTTNKSNSNNNNNLKCGGTTKPKEIKKTRKRAKKEPPDERSSRENLRDGKGSDGEEVGFRNGIIQDVMVRPQRKKARMDYAEMHEGGPREAALDEEAEQQDRPQDEESTLEIVEENTAADNYVMLDEAPVRTAPLPGCGSPLQPSLQTAVTASATAFRESSSSAETRQQIPVPSPLELRPAGVAGASVPLVEQLNCATAAPAVIGSAATTTAAPPLPNPQMLPPGLEPGQLVLFAPHGASNALHLFVVNPPIAGGDSTTLSAVGDSTQEPTVKKATCATGPSVPESLPAHSDSRLTTEANTRVTGRAPETSVSSQPGVLPMTADCVSAAPREEPEIVERSDANDAESAARHDATPQTLISATVNDLHVNAVDAKAAKEATPADFPKPEAAAVRITAAGSAAKKPLPKVAFRSRARKGSVAPLQSAIADTPASIVDGSDGGGSPTVSQVLPEGRGRIPAEASANSAASKQLEGPRHDRKPAILSRRRAPLLVRRSLAAKPSDATTSVGIETHITEQPSETPAMLEPLTAGGSSVAVVAAAAAAPAVAGTSEDTLTQQDAHLSTDSNAMRSEVEQAPTGHCNEPNVLPQISERVPHVKDGSSVGDETSTQHKALTNSSIQRSSRTRQAEPAPCPDSSVEKAPTQQDAHLSNDSDAMQSKVDEQTPTGHCKEPGVLPQISERVPHVNDSASVEEVTSTQLRALTNSSIQHCSPTRQAEPTPCPASSVVKAATVSEDRSKTARLSRLRRGPAVVTARKATVSSDSVIGSKQNTYTAAEPATAKESNECVTDVTSRLADTASIRDQLPSISGKAATDSTSGAAIVSEDRPKTGRLSRLRRGPVVAATRKAVVNSDLVSDSKHNTCTAEPVADTKNNNVVGDVTARLADTASVVDKSPPFIAKARQGVTDGTNSSQIAVKAIDVLRSSEQLHDLPAKTAKCTLSTASAVAANRTTAAAAATATTTAATIAVTTTEQLTIPASSIMAPTTVSPATSRASPPPPPTNATAALTFTAASTAMAPALVTTTKAIPTVFESGAPVTAAETSVAVTEATDVTNVVMTPTEAEVTAATTTTTKTITQTPKTLSAKRTTRTTTSAAKTAETTSATMPATLTTTTTARPVLARTRTKASSSAAMPTAHLPHKEPNPAPLGAAVSIEADYVPPLRSDFERLGNEISLQGTRTSDLSTREGATDGEVSRQRSEAATPSKNDLAIERSNAAPATPKVENTTPSTRTVVAKTTTTRATTVEAAAATTVQIAAAAAITTPIEATAATTTIGAAIATSTATTAKVTTTSTAKVTTTSTAAATTTKTAKVTTTSTAAPAAPAVTRSAFALSAGATPKAEATTAAITSATSSSVVPVNSPTVIAATASPTSTRHSSSGSTGGGRTLTTPATSDPRLHPAETGGAVRSPAGGAKVVLPVRHTATHVVRPIRVPTVKGTLLSPITVRRPPVSTMSPSNSRSKK